MITYQPRISLKVSSQANQGEGGSLPLVHVEHLVKTYQQQPILKDLSLELAAGSSTALLGPSGCGKTTLLNCLGGIEPIDTGSIRIGAAFLEKLQAEELAALRRTEIGTIFQFFYLLPTLTLYENIEFPLQLLGVTSAERSQRVVEVIEKVGLAHRQDALPSELSGGEIQRTAVARAVVHRPRLILADEPTGNLDSHTGEAILSLLKELVAQEKITLLMVTHSDEAASICDAVLRMKDGVFQEEAAQLPKQQFFREKEKEKKR